MILNAHHPDYIGKPNWTLQLLNHSHKEVSLWQRTIATEERVVLLNNLIISLGTELTRMMYDLDTNSDTRPIRLRSLLSKEIL